MNYRPRIYYTETQRTLMWDRWQKGDSLYAIEQTVIPVSSRKLHRNYRI